MRWNDLQVSSIIAELEERLVPDRSLVRTQPPRFRPSELGVEGRYVVHRRCRVVPLCNDSDAAGGKDGDDGNTPACKRKKPFQLRAGYEAGTDEARGAAQGGVQYVNGGDLHGPLAVHAPEALRESSAQRPGQ